MLKESAQQNHVDFEGIKQKWGLEDFCHQASKNNLAQGFMALAKKNAFLSKIGNVDTVESNNSPQYSNHLQNYDSYFCQDYREDSSNHYGKFSPSFESSQNLRNSPGISNEHTQLFSKILDEEELCMWNNNDWLCKPEKYGTEIDMLSDSDNFSARLKGSKGSIRLASGELPYCD